MFAKSASEVLTSLHAHLRGEDAEPTRISLADASALLACVGMHIAPGTLRYYASGKRAPRLPAMLDGKTWRVNPDDVIVWALRYKDAPKRGRRGKR